MRGHDRIIASRLQRVAPAVVTLWDAPAIRFGVVEIEPADQPLRADLRFVVGLPVHVLHGNPQAALAWAQACKRAGATNVTAYGGEPPRGQFTLMTADGAVLAAKGRWEHTCS